MGRTGRGDRPRDRVRTALLAAAVLTAAAVGIALLAQTDRPAPARAATTAMPLSGAVMPFIPPTPHPTPGADGSASPYATPAPAPPAAP